MISCTSAQIIGILGKKWTSHIIATFMKENRMKFGDFRRAFPHVTPRLLTQRLRELEDFGVLEQLEYKKENYYSITQKGIFIGNTLCTLDSWKDLKK